MKKIIAFFIFLFSISTFAQQEANIWYFGRNAGIDFNTTPPTAITNSALSTFEGCSSFSDTNGNLLFYTDGTTVYDKNHTVMRYTNGNLANNLRGNPSSTQSGMIIPKPGSASIYYLFTVGDWQNPAFDLYTIDMSLNAGLGQLIDENNDGVFFEDLATPTGSIATWSEKVAAVKGNECNTFWVVSFSNRTFYAYKIDASGVTLTPVTSTVSNTSYSISRGYLKLSPDGTKLAIAHQNQGTQCLLYSFNNLTGAVGNDEVNIFNNDGEAYGLEFSRSSEKLYLSSVSGFRYDLSDNPVNYKLFQFDLTSTNIASTQSTIHQQVGYRGALQLGPDGKIYATIPLAYDDPQGDAEYLDVIENPNADASDIVFTQNAIYLNGMKSTQGLPPFISSLLLPLEITEVGETIPLNNQTYNACSGTDITFTPEAITGNPNYVWTFDNGTSTIELSNSTNSDLALTNLSDTQHNGVYTLTATTVDPCGIPTTLEGEFTLEVFENVITNPINDWNYCDTDNDGLNSFDLQAICTPQIVGTQNTTIFEVLYYTDFTDAENNITANALANPYTNPTAFSTQTIYARIQNRGFDGCYAITDFQLSVSGLPLAIIPTDYKLCDDVASGSDTDGFVENFLLSTKDTEILGALDVTQYTVSYYALLADATTGSGSSLIDKTIPYRNTIVNYQTVYIRVENNDNTTCSDTSKTLNLVVDDLPILASPGSPYALEQCDDSSNDGNANFNLNNINNTIINPITTEAFTFYTTEALALAGVTGTEITNNIDFPVTGNTGVVWTRVENDNACFRTAQVDLTITPSAINPSYTLTACDDFLDIDGNDTAANDDTDGVTFFDFQNEIDLISANFTGTSGVSISCHHTQADADAGSNPIDPTTYSNYRNSTSPNTEQIWVRVVSSLGSQCLANGNFITLNVNPIPTLNTVLNLENCDDTTDGNDTNGIGVTFDLESQSNAIRPTGTTAADFSVSYHVSNADAVSGNAPQSSPFINTSNSQTIYVRVVNTATGCVNPHTTFNLEVNPLPIIDFTTISLTPLCDDDTDGDAHNGIGVTFDLGSLTTSFQGLQVDNATVNYNVTYHETLADATTPLISLPNLYENIVNNQPIFVRIENEDTACVRIEEAINYLVVKPIPILNPITIDAVCDNDDDDNDTNEIVTWNLDDTMADFIVMQPTTTDTFTVTFHTTLAGASADVPTDQITTTYAYENTSNPQEIFVRIVNDITTCYNAIHAFTLEVNSLPNFDLATEDMVCENILPHIISVENPADTYSYQWFDSENNLIGTSQTLSITDTASITSEGVLFKVIATNTTTLCRRKKEIVLKKSSIATITETDIVTVEFSNPNNTIEILTANLGSGDYEFSLEHSFDTQPWQNSPIFTGLAGGLYEVLVRDKNGCGQVSIGIVLLDYPKFFTPNNDGENDTWQLIGLASKNFKSSPVYIFDRFGKVITQITPTSIGWNGMYLGKESPSDDYWFTVTITDITTQNAKQYKGHFSLIRR